MKYKDRVRRVCIEKEDFLRLITLTTPGSCFILRPICKRDNVCKTLNFKTETGNTTLYTTRHTLPMNRKTGHP